MKWSSTFATLMVLAVAAPVQADVFGRYQRVAHEESSPVIEGPVMTAPHQTSASTSVLRSRADGSIESIDPQTPLGGTMGGHAGYGYGGRSVATGGSCCLDRNEQAAELWGDYCTEKKSCGWPAPGWLAGRLGCGSCCAPPRPVFAGWKPCTFSQAPARGCEQPAVDCACAEPACPSCGSDPCACRKPGPLMSFFAALRRKHDCGCDQAPACSDGAHGHDWSSPYEDFDGSYESLEDVEVYDEEVIEPALPPAPLPTDDAAEVVPPTKSARRGLLPEGFRLFPAFQG